MSSRTEACGLLRPGSRSVSATSGIGPCRAAAQHGLSDAAKAQLMMTLTMFGRAPVEQLADSLPYSKHIHGKFYEVDGSGTEPSIPYPQLFALLREKGYAGTISAEWEGHAFTEEPIGFEQVVAWKAMCARLLGG